MVMSKFGRAAVLAGVGAAAAWASDLTIHLPGDAAMQRNTVSYRCDGNGRKLGMPAGPFSVEYINGGGNSLVVVPVAGKGLIFANVAAGSGARYVAQQWTWWEAGGAVTLSSDTMGGKAQTTCRPVKSQ
jgi:membrane-bound inhibitor of C-type lysozyme